MLAITEARSTIVKYLEVGAVQLFKKAVAFLKKRAPLLMVCLVACLEVLEPFTKLQVLGSVIACLKVLEPFTKL